MSNNPEINLVIPKACKVLFEEKRYKILYGGRGSSKSWSIAAVLVAVMAIKRPMRILCTREIQKSILQSVHKVLCVQIERLGLSKHYTITKTSIMCHNGTEFLFYGLLHNVDQIKSTEGIDICWVSEAHNVSEESWDILLPTIREKDSEIWVDFNPKFEDDDTYVRWVTNTPENAVARLINYPDNPFFPEVLRVEMEADKSKDIELYKQKWLGSPRGIGGRVWPQFDKATHIREFPRELISEKATCYMSMDPHAHYYPFCVWVALIPKNQRGEWPEDYYKHIYAEWPTFDDLGDYYHNVRKTLFYKGTLKDMAAEIHAKDGIEYGIKVKKRFIDTRFAKGSGGWNWSTSTAGVVEQFAKNENGGLKFEMPYEKTIDAQREKIKTDMTYNELVEVNQFNEPSFSVDPRCKNVIASLRNHRLEEGSEKESEKYKDPSDALRINYAGFQDLGPKKEKEKVRSFRGGGGGSWMH